MSAARVLDILRDGAPVASCELQGEMVLGRSEDCAIRLDDRAISRHHAVLRSVPDGVQVERRSQFGVIRVNGTERTQALVKEGDVVEIGPYRLRLGGSAVPRLDAAAPLEATPAATTLELPDPVAALEDSNRSDSGGEIALDAPFERASVEPDAEVLSLESPAAEPDFGGDPFAAAEVDAPVLEGISLEESPPMSLESPMADDAGFRLEPPVEAASENSETRLAPADSYEAKLLFGENEADVSEFAIGDREISLGRGKECDVVLNNKKASRKHAVIRKENGRFLIEDLGSANGTIVNGKKIKRYELTGDDVIRIGAQEYRFQVSSPEYVRQEGQFVPVEEPSATTGSAPLPEFGLTLAPSDESTRALDPYEAAQLASASSPDFGLPSQLPPPLPPLPGSTPISQQGTQSGVMGIPGVAAPAKKGSLLEKFRALPPARQAIWAFIVLGILYFGLFDEDEIAPVAQKAKPTAAAVKKDQPGGPTFETLTPEQQRFVEAQHALAFDHYKNKEYDKALYEIRKIFALINDYKDSREIERYAIEGKRKLEALEEERKKREEEKLLKARIEQLVQEARAFMDKKDYTSARDLFYEILAVDPDNAQVAEWKRVIEQWEEEQRLLETQRQVEAEINRRAWEEYRLGMEQKTAGKFRTAIASFAKIKDMGASDQKVVKSAAQRIAECLRAIAASRDPLLAQAKEAESEGDLKRAFDLYRRATRVDPDHPAGYAGMNRLRDALREQARVLYAEGVMAESYSDFDTAKARFAEVMEKSPEDDLYYERAQRKLNNYFRREPASTP